MRNGEGIALAIKKQALTILPVSQRVSLSSHIQSQVSSLWRETLWWAKPAYWVDAVYSIQYTVYTHTHTPGIPLIISSCSSHNVVKFDILTCLNPVNDLTVTAVTFVRNVVRTNVWILVLWHKNGFVKSQWPLTTTFWSVYPLSVRSLKLFADLTFTRTERTDNQKSKCLRSELLPAHRHENLRPLPDHSLSVWMCACVCVYLVPGHRLSSEQRAGQLHWQTFLVVLRFVLRHAEQDGCSIGCYRKQCTETHVT